MRAANQTATTAEKEAATQWRSSQPESRRQQDTHVCGTRSRRVETKVRTVGHITLLKLCNKISWLALSLSITSNRFPEGDNSEKKPLCFLRQSLRKNIETILGKHAICFLGWLCD